MIRHPMQETRTLAQLSQEHEHLERWFVDIAERASTGDPRECDAVWTEFVQQLESHMAFEEKEVFPLYEKRGTTASAVVRDLCQEHTAIRQAVEMIGMELQLHLARASIIESFLAALRGHARRERETIYLG